MDNGEVIDLVLLVLLVLVLVEGEDSNGTHGEDVCPIWLF